MIKKIFMLTSMLIVLFHISCDNKKENKEVETTYLVTSPAQLDTSVTEDYVCQIRAIRHIELRAQERGYLQKIYVDEGQLVKEGQLLFQIMPNLYEAEMQKAQAEVNFADIEYQNTKTLTDGNVVSPNELAMAKAKLDKAKAELSLAKVHLEFTKIRARYDGLIDRFHVREGSLLEEGELLTELSDNSKMWVYFNVPEAEYLDYKIKFTKGEPMNVGLLMANNQLFKHGGVVETIEADFNSETGNIPFRATFPNPDALLRHGEIGNIQMKVSLKKALIIPQKTTYEILDKKYVFVVDENNTIHSRQITISEEMQHLYVVTDGLKATDKILLEGLRKVKENDKIKFEFLQPSKVISDLSLYAE
jgi:membrane fusion protein (multidrug efflux system)